MWKSWFAVAWLLIACVPGEGGENSYDEVWRDVSILVKHRQYESASKVLEGALDDPALEKATSLIESDRAVVQGLADFEGLVNARCAELKPGDKIKAGVNEYTFVRLEKGTADETLVVQTNESKRERKLTVKDLPSSAWVSLAEPQLKTLKQKDLVVGVFLALDRFPDRKSARKLLDKAAANGSEVDVWIKRLGAAEGDEKAKPAKAEADPIVGHWRMVWGTGNKQVRETVEFKKDGKTASHGKWTLNNDDIYVWTARGGGTARLTMKGDELIGKWANGVEIHGSRQAERSTKK